MAEIYNYLNSKMKARKIIKKNREEIKIIIV